MNQNEKFLDKYFIKNKRVKTIRLNDKNVIDVKCDDGSQYSAQHVIVTVSLGVLKQNYQTLFGDGLELPQEKIATIRVSSRQSVPRDLLFLAKIVPTHGRARREKTLLEKNYLPAKYLIVK